MKTILLLIGIAFSSFSVYSSELFIRVARQGVHTAVVYNQTQSNPSNVFRFFDLPSGNTSIQIIDQQSGVIVYNTSIFLANNQHISAELDLSGNLVIVQTMTVNQMNWYSCVYSNNSNGNMLGNGTNSQQVNANNDAFNQFLLSLDNEGFDSNKLAKSKAYVNKGNLSAQQITEISKKFSFDSNRLDWAKYAYNRCYDKANYFLIKETFAFQSNYTELEKYIDAQ